MVPYVGDLFFFSFVLFLLSIVALCGTYHNLLWTYLNLFVHSSVDGHLDCFQVLHIAEFAIYTSFCDHVFSLS